MEVRGMWSYSSRVSWPSHSLLVRACFNWHY